MEITKSQSIDSLGACQGVSYQNGRIFLYGDREIGVIREYKESGDSLQYLNNEIRLTIAGQDLINHPTGMAVQGNLPVFIGNSVRLNAEGSLWKAVIYQVNWEGLQQTRTLDGNLVSTIDDDTCIQGTRPEYVQYQDKWYVATADYGGKANEVRLYDPVALAKAKKTSEKGVLVKKFSCSPWVQNLLWIPEKKQLVLIQNQVEGRKWRFTYVDLDRSIASGKEVVLRVVDIDERADELEGFAFTGSLNNGIGVSSSRRNNVNRMQVNW
ncbi:MAG: hypothetical protein HYU71_10490 [Bacteroidetes bacterium]|nr:hypothetical protein [Bacteroidota bacterium]